MTPIKWTLILFGLAVAFGIYTLGVASGARIGAKRYNDLAETFAKILRSKNAEIKRMVRKVVHLEWIHEHLEDSSQ